LPAAQFYKRAGFPLKKIVEYAAKREYSDVLVVNEDRKSVNGLLVVHLPAGPSVHFKLSKLVLGADIPVCCPAAEDSAMGICVSGARCATGVLGFRVAFILRQASECDDRGH